MTTDSDYQSSAEKIYAAALTRAEETAQTDRNDNDAYALSHIRDNHLIETGKGFRVHYRRAAGLGLLFEAFGMMGDDKTLNKFIFTAPKKPVVESGGTPALMACAHEIQHAILKEQDVVEDRKNISSISRRWRTLDSLSPPIFKIAEKIMSWLEDKDDDKKFTLLAKKSARFLTGLVFAPLSPVAMLGRLIHRQEEFNCDDYALANYPDGDLKAYRRMLYSYDGAKAEKEIAKNEKRSTFDLQLRDFFYCESHPHPERRYRRMVKLQQQMQQHKL